MGPGQLIADRFVIDRPIGAGGMGTVYRAHDRVTGEPVAVKFVTHAAGLERFEREAKLLAALEHPRVVRYVAHGKLDEGAPYLVMEWLEGEDLEARLARGALTLEDAQVVASAAADVLAATHRRGIVHRDIKPSNLFLVGGKIDALKVLDFGIARGGGGHAALTGTGMLLGTPAYMAPEQARGEANLDARVDVFALGCVLFECLSGKPPFSGEHAVAVLAKVLLEDAPQLSELHPEIPLAVSTLVERMLQKDRDARPADGAALTLELERVRNERAGANAAPALTRAERRMVSVAITASAATLDDTLLPAERSLVERRAAAVTEARGGRLAVLANGAMVAVVEGGGSPKDQAVRAARVALGLSNELGSTPVALSTGYATTTDRVPTGEAIDRAVRRLALGSSTSPTGVRIDRATAALLDARFRVSGDGEDLYLQGETEEDEQPRKLLGRSTAFVGRDRELGALLATLDECAGDSVARATLITAPAGVGKTRLVTEFLRSVRSQHEAIEVIVARGDPSSAGSAFGLAAKLLTRAAGATPGDRPQVRAEALTRRILRHMAPERGEPTVEFLLEIADAPLTDEHASVALRAARQDARMMNDSVRSAWDAWLDAECRAHTVLLVLEDLQWGDLPSVRLVDSVLRNSADQPLMVLATARPEVHTLFSSLWGERQLAEIRLGPVAKRAAERFVKDALRSPDAETLKFVVERAAGHPFFLEELVRALAEGRKKEELPESVIGMVQARLDALGSTAKRVLRAASVFGNSSWTGGITRLLGEDAASTEKTCEELVAKELLESRAASSIPGERELVFRHAVIRDAAYETLTEADRALGHRLAGEWLEDTGDHDPRTLALHFDRGGDRVRARAHYVRAAEEALLGNDVEGTISLARLAIEYGAEGEEKAHLELLCAEAEFWRGDLRESERLARAAAAAFRPSTRRWYDATALALLVAGQQGDNDRVEEWLGVVGPTEAEPGALEAQIRCLCRGISQVTYGHRRDQAMAALRRVDELAPEPEALSPTTAAWVNRVRGETGMYFRGDLYAMVVGQERAAEQFERAGALRDACLCRLLFASCLSLSGAYVESQTHTARAMQDAERLGSNFLVHFAWDIISLTATLEHDHARAVEAARRCLEVMSGNVRIESAMHCALALGHLAENDLTAAAIEAERAEVIGRDNPMRPMALGVQSMVMLARGRVAEARSLAEEGVKLQTAAVAFEPFDGLPELALVEALIADGDRPEASRVVAAALEALARVARSLPTPEHRARFLTRPLPNGDLVALARELGVQVPDLDPTD